MGAMIVAVWSAWYVGHRQADGTDAARSVEAAPSAADEAALEAPRPGVYDRVVRVVAFLFIAVVGVAVAVTGSWPDTEVAVYLLLGGGHAVRRLHAGPAAGRHPGSGPAVDRGELRGRLPDRAGRPHRRPRQPLLPGLLPARGRRLAVHRGHRAAAAGAAGRVPATSSSACWWRPPISEPRASRGWPSTSWRWRCWRSSPRSRGASSAAHARRPCACRASIP